MNSFNVFHFEEKNAEPLVFLRTLGLLSLRSSINFVSCPFLYELLEIRGHILLNLARICFAFKQQGGKWTILDATFQNRSSQKYKFNSPNFIFLKSYSIVLWHYCPYYYEASGSFPSNCLNVSSSFSDLRSLCALRQHTVCGKYIFLNTGTGPIFLK